MILLIIMDKDSLMFLIKLLFLFRCYRNYEYKPDNNPLEFCIKQLTLNLNKVF